MFGGVCGIDESGNTRGEDFGDSYGRYYDCKNTGEVKGEENAIKGNLIGAENTPSHVTIINNGVEEEK